jgi:beta-glucosidase
MQFPKGFLLGAATSAYQIEGAYNLGGRGLSIWDVFSHSPSKIHNNENGDVACDHYHRFEEDVALMQELGLQTYRFSVSWSRVLPTGRGEVNSEGLQFYDNLVDALIKAKIVPQMTLYHWDLPQALQEEGGWQNRKVIDDYLNYAKILFDHFNGRVQIWTTFNEVFCIAALGHSLGVFAPGFKDPQAAVTVAHHVNLAHARAVGLFRESAISGQIGIVQCMLSVHREQENNACIQNARMADGLFNRWYIEPSLLGEYPADIVAYNQRLGLELPLEAGDMDELRSNRGDFFGLNYYERIRVSDTPQGAIFDWHSCVNLKPVKDSYYTEMGWEVYPEGIYEILLRLKKDYNNPVLYVSENGAAMKDQNLKEGVVQDVDRLGYLQAHLVQCKNALDSGVDLRGYYYWSFLDNFEWARGFVPRFGLVHVDYKTQVRTPKMSAQWYSEFIKSQNQL